MLGFVTHSREPGTGRLEATSLILAGLLVTGLLSLLPGTARLEAQTCTCSATSAVGSCRIKDVALTNPYLGQYPGASVVVPLEGAAVLIVTDFFNGQSYLYSAADLLLSMPTVFPSPRGGRTTSGVAYDAVDGRLYWAVDNTIVVSALPNLAVNAGRVARVDDMGAELPPLFEDAVDDDGNAIELDIDLAAVAEGIYGDTDRAGRLGGITFHAGRRTLWCIDIVNDIAFEVSPEDGSLVRDEGGVPIHVRNPRSTDASPKAFGHALVYVRVPGELGAPEEEYFDYLCGAHVEGRATSVVRLSAPTEPSETNPLGSEAGIEYSLEGLIPGDEGQQFPTAISLWTESCGAGNNSALILAFNPLAPADSANATDKHGFIELAADDPTVTNVTGFTASVANEGSILLEWTNPRLFDELEITRRSVSGDDPDEVQVFLSPEIEPHPESFLDVSLPIPVDGTYEYSVIARNAEGLASAPIARRVTLGRGSLLGLGSVGASAAGAAGAAPYGLTLLGDQLVIPDALTGRSTLVNTSDLSVAGTIPGPFAGLSATTGVTHDSTDDRLVWLGRDGTRPLLTSTATDGTGIGAVRTVQFPSEFVRTPELGDLAYDAVRDQYWLTDLTHQAIYAVNDSGQLIPDSVIENPIAGGKLGGGIAIAAADDTSVTLDIVTGDSAPDRIVRNTYTLDSLATPETVQTLFVRDVIQSNRPGGVVGGTFEERDALFVVGNDSSNVYALRLEEADLTGFVPFARGDANNDTALNISDPSFILGWMFRDGAEPPCMSAADANADDAINITDAVFLFGYLFRDGGAPPSPFPTCGFEAEANPEGLGCEESICLGADEV